MKGATDKLTQQCRSNAMHDNPWRNWTYVRTTSTADYQEHYFIKYWLTHLLPRHHKIIQIRSDCHVGGKVCFEIKSRPDLYLVTTDPDDRTHVYLIHYDGTYW